jgi:hypothetical protein
MDSRQHSCKEESKAETVLNSRLKKLRSPVLWRVKYYSPHFWFLLPRTPLDYQISLIIQSYMFSTGSFIEPEELPATLLKPAPV